MVHLCSYLFAVCNVHHLGTRWSANRMLTPNHRFVVIVSYHSLNRVPILVINKYKLIKSDTNPCKSALFHMPRLADIIQPSTWFITNWNINFCSPSLSHSLSLCTFLFAVFFWMPSKYSNYLHESFRKFYFYRLPCAFASIAMHELVKCSVNSVMCRFFLPKLGHILSGWPVEWHLILTVCIYRKRSCILSLS